MSEDKASEADKRFYKHLMGQFDQLQKADVIIGKHQTGEAVCYGMQLLRDIAARIEPESKRNVLRVEYDASEASWQLEILCYVVEQAKGRCDYEATRHPVTDGNHRHGRGTHGRKTR